MKKLLMTTALVFSLAIHSSANAHSLYGGSFNDGYNRGVIAYESGDYETALSEWLAVAEPNGPHYGSSGHNDAQYNLGIMYYKGIGVAQDYDEAVKWFRMEIAQGWGRATVILGIMNQEGQGTAQDYTEAMKWYRRGSNSDGLSQRHIGLLHKDGLGVPQNNYLAHVWFTLAVENGDEKARGHRDEIEKLMTRDEIAQAQYGLGILYAEATYVDYNRFTAFMWYSLAATSGNEIAILLRDEMEGLIRGGRSEEMKKRVREFIAERN